MCQGPMHEFLRALPKCEHHMHLEGSLSPQLLFDLAERNRIALPPPTEDAAFTSPETLVARYQNFSSLDDFLHYYFIGMTALRTAADFEDLAYAYFSRAHADGVHHAEVFFDPQAHTSRGVAYETVVAGIRAGQERAQQAFGLSSLLIVCILRHLPAADGERMYRAAVPDMQAGVVAGLGLSSTEIDHPPSWYAAPFQDAGRRGFRRTAHAGEEAGVEYMASAVRDLGVTRVDHGIKLAADPALMAEFAARRILVTLCPLSNVALKCVPDVRDVPVRVYLDAGVAFSLNSDDPAYFGGCYILDNFCAVQHAFALSVAEWAVICANAIEGSWCGEDRKLVLRETLARVIKDAELS